jgi:hypothetical protein
VHCLVFLHLVALDVQVELVVLFVTLGNYRHLAVGDWRIVEQRVVIVSCSNRSIVWGSCAYSTWDIHKRQL